MLFRQRRGHETTVGIVISYVARGCLCPVKQTKIIRVIVALMRFCVCVCVFVSSHLLHTEYEDFQSTVAKWGHFGEVIPFSLVPLTVQDCLRVRQGFTDEVRLGFRLRLE